MTIRDTRMDWNYSVLESDNKRNLMTIETDVGLGDSAGYKVSTGMVLQFSKNRKVITEISEGPEGRTANKCKHADSSIQP